MVKNFMERLESAINFLPPVPVVVLELLNALDNPDVDINMLSRIISKDPAMSVNVLKVANSVFYRLPYKVDTIDYAVQILGMKEITMICIACGAYNALKPAPSPRGFDYSAFWKHSVTTGVIARRLSRELGMENQAIVYLCGLLHDIGKIVLHRAAEDLYATAIQAVHEDGISMVEAEKRFLGESHDTVGGLIMEKWRLPRLFTDVARCHHTPGNAPEDNRRSVALQYLSDRLAKSRYPFHSDTGDTSIASTEAFDILAQGNPRLVRLDLHKSAWVPQGTDNEIAEMLAMFTA
jgi:putative nucleotidyltransferase with HDIG domain